MTQIINPNMKNTAVLINGIRLPGVRLEKTLDDRKLYSVRELLSGETGALPSEESYRIILVFGAESEFYSSGEFTLTLSTPEFVNTFSSCRVTKIQEILKAPNNYELEYEITARNKAQIER